MNRYLVFSCTTEDTFKDGKLLYYGDITYNPPFTEIKDSFKARSGLKLYQGNEFWWTRGKGSIPPSNDVLNTQRVYRNLAYNNIYNVNLYPYHSDKVNGLAFRITPNPMVYNKDTTKIRGDILIHSDGGLGVGTSGCIGLYDNENTVDDNSLEFQRFCKLAEDLRSKGMHTIPLITLYNDNSRV